MIFDVSYPTQIQFVELFQIYKKQLNIKRFRFSRVKKSLKKIKKQLLIVNNFLLNSNDVMLCPEENCIF